MIRGVKIVSIPVSNQDVSLKFYTEKLGFKVATDQSFGEGQRWIFATAALLKSKGVELAAEPKKEVWGTMAKFKDPDGNEFVFSSR